MSYKGFISYSHASDGQLAPAIQSALHRFAKPWYRLRAVRVFRDKSSLSASPALWPSIEQALADSEFFLLCASPASAASKWVRQEIQWWLSHRTADKMLILLTEGELAWDAGISDFDWTRTTSISPELSKQFRDEPLFVDLRWARQADNLSLRHSQFRGAILDIAAPLHGRPKDELDGEDVRQHRRTRLISAAAVLGILLFAIAAVWQAYEANLARDAEVVQRKEAERQRDRAIASLLQVESERLSLVDGQWDLAALLGVESLRMVENPGTYGLLSKMLSSSALPSARLITKGGGSAVAFSPDGKLVATGDYDDLIVFRAAGGREVLRAPHGGGSLRAVHFTPSGRRVLTATDDRVRLFELPAGGKVAEMSQGTWNAVLGFSGNGRFLARAEGAEASVRDAETLRELATAGHTELITTLGISDDGSLAALASGHEATLVDVRTGVRKSLRTANDIAAVAFSPDGRFAAFDPSDLKLLPAVFDTAAGKEQPQMAQEALGWFGPGRWYSLSPQQGSGLVDVFDRWTQVLAGFLHHDGAIGRVEWSRDGELLAIGAGNKGSSTTVFQTSTWQRIARFKFQGQVSVQALAISPKSDLIASTWERGTTVFHPHQGRSFAILPPLDAPTAITVSEAGNVVAARYGSKEVLFMKPGNPAPLTRFDGCRLSKFSALAARGTRFVVGCGDGTVRVVDPAGRTPAVSIPHAAAVDPALSPDGKLVFAVTPDGAAVLDSTQGTVLKRLGNSAERAVFSSDNLRVAVSRAGRVELHDLRGAKPPQVLHDQALVESLAFSPDGRLLAIGDRNRFVHVYAAASGKLLAKLDHKEEERQELRIRPVVLSPSGTRLASLTQDATDPESPFMLHVFDLSTRNEIIRVALTDRPRWLRFAPGEAAVEIAFGRRSLRLERFALAGRELLQAACARVGRNLDETEWARYMPGQSFRQTCAAINPAAQVIP